MKRPYAYIRRSVVRKSDPGDVSAENQTTAVRRLAGDDAVSLVILDRDWGKPAAHDKTDKRLAFLGLMDSIERGEVSTLYAYMADRLARSVEWSSRLLNACERANVSIVTSEGRFAPGDDLARTQFHFLAIQNENYSRQGSRRQRDASDVLRKRGAHLGQPYYGALAGESLDTVLATFERMGSFMATARELNRIGLPSRRGHWAPSSVQRILERAGRTKALRSGTGRKARAPHLFSGLLRCACGHLLTGSLRAPDRQGRRLTIYRCVPAESDPDHGKKSIVEAIVLRWAQDQTARLRPPKERVQLAENVAARRVAIEGQLDTLREAVLAGVIDKAAMLTRKAAIDADLAALDAEGRAVTVPSFTWSAPTAETNEALRTLWSEIALGPDMALPERPVRLLPAGWWAD
jgi:DNA invertase Pin-like site-specific DNA recombinase